MTNESPRFAGTLEIGWHSDEIAFKLLRPLGSKFDDVLQSRDFRGLA